MTITTPKQLNYNDGFKMLHDTPKRIEIMDFEFYEEFLPHHTFLFQFYITSTNQSVGFFVDFPYRRNNKFYVGFDHVLHPLLSFINGTPDNAIILTEDDLTGLIGREFLATVKYRPNKSRTSDTDINKDYKYTIVPLEELTE